MVPTFTCGLSRLNASLAISILLVNLNYLIFCIVCYRFSGCSGAHDRDGTGDLVLTKDVLYQLSYMGCSSPTQRLRGIPVSPPTRDSKVPKPRQICNLNDHGTASFQQKASAS